MSWAMQRVSAAGFIPHGTPDLVRATVLEKCGFQPRGDNTQVRGVFQPKQLIKPVLDVFTYADLQFELALAQTVLPRLYICTK